MVAVREAGGGRWRQKQRWHLPAESCPFLDCRMSPFAAWLLTRARRLEGLPKVTWSGAGFRVCGVRAVESGMLLVCSTCVPRDSKSSACLMLQGLCWASHGWTNHRVGPRIVSGEVVTDFELTQYLNVYVL